MKKLLFIILIILFTGCDPDFCGKYIVKNVSGENLRIHLNEKSYIINNNDYYILQKEKCGLGGVTELQLYDYDSIYLSNLNNKAVKIYKPLESYNEDVDCIKKNIYNIYCWSAKKLSKYYIDHTFIITSKDIGE